MYYLGIDLGGTNIAAGIVNKNGEIIIKDSVPTIRGRHYVEIIKDMGLLSQDLISKAGLKVKDVASIGIGSPGTPDKKEGVLLYSNNLGFVNVPMRLEMQKYLELPVYLENDANCAALAESVAGAAKGSNSSITVTLGTGIGGGVVIDNKVFSGFNGAASELGHMVICVDGEQCTCGRKGCWEVYASATALINQTKKAAFENKDSKINSLVDNDLEKINAKTAFDAQRMGDEIGNQVVDQYIEYLKEGIANLINIFQPEIIVIGGGISKEKENLLTPLNNKLEGLTYCYDSVENTKIVTAKMGNDAGIVGAAMLGKK